MFARLPVAPAATGLLAVGLGFAVVQSPRYAIVAAAGAAAAIAIARIGMFWVAALVTVLIPWGIVYSDYAPHGIRTTFAGVVGVSLLIAARPLLMNRGLAWATVALVGAIIASAITAGAEGHLEAERMLLFPIMVLALSSERSHELVTVLRRWLLLSGGVALASQVVLSAAHQVPASSYYGVGEDLGLAQRPHELAFLGTMVACGSLLVFRRGWLAFAIFAVSSYVVLDSGVRTGVLAIAAFVAVKFVSRTRRVRDVLLVGAGLLVVVKTNAINVVFDRFNSNYSHGGGLTSHRSEIWSNAWHHFTSGDLLTWLTGTGLGSVMRFSMYDLDLGDRGPSHSDIVAVGIQLGLIGLTAYALIWVWLIRRLEYRVALVPVAIFAFGNGLIDRTDAMVVALLVAGAASLSRASAPES